MPALYVTPANPVLTIAPPPFGPVPVLPGTLLRLELLRHRNSLDLTAATGVLCADPGALLHLLSLVAEQGSAEDVPLHRLEDFVASIPIDRLLDRLAGHTVRSPRQHAMLTRFAEHAGCISYYACCVASTFQLSADQAMLVGSLHELAQLPALLGWQPLAPTPSEASLLCSDLCRQYCLPSWLQEALKQLHPPFPIHPSTAVPLWAAVTAAAHELASATVNAR